MFEQLWLEIGLGIAMGTLIAIVSCLSSNEAWNNRKLGYSMVIGVFTAFAIIEGVVDGVTAENVIQVVLLIAGASFFTNKAIGMAQRVNDKQADLD